MNDNTVTHRGKEITIREPIAKIFRAKIAGVKNIAPHQLQVTKSVDIIGFNGWEYMGRIEGTTGRVFSRCDGHMMISGELPERLVGMVDVTPHNFKTSEDYDSRAIVYRVSFSGGREGRVVELTLPGVGSVTGYRVGVINESFRDTTVPLPDGSLALWEDGHASGYRGRLFLGLVDNQGGIFVPPDSGGTSRVAAVQCGYIKPAIDVTMMAGAAMLQIFGALMVPWR